MLQSSRGYVTCTAAGGRWHCQSLVVVLQKEKDGSQGPVSVLKGGGVAEFPWYCCRGAGDDVSHVAPTREEQSHLVLLLKEAVPEPRRWPEGYRPLGVRC